MYGPASVGRVGMIWDQVGIIILGICVLEIERLSSDNRIMILDIISGFAKKPAQLTKTSFIKYPNRKV